MRRLEGHFGSTSLYKYISNQTQYIYLSLNPRGNAILLPLKCDNRNVNKRPTWKTICKSGRKVDFSQTSTIQSNKNRTKVRQWAFSAMLMMTPTAKFTHHTPLYVGNGRSGIESWFGNDTK